MSKTKSVEQKLASGAAIIAEQFKIPPKVTTKKPNNGNLGEMWLDDIIGLVINNKRASPNDFVRPHCSIVDSEYRSITDGWMSLPVALRITFGWFMEYKYWEQLEDVLYEEKIK